MAPAEQADSTATDTAGLQDTPWYQASVGKGIFAFDVLLTLALVLLTAFHLELELLTVDPLAADEPVLLVPWPIYVFALLGALGYIFTTLVDDIHRSAFDLLGYNLRLPAALPLGVGIFLFSGILLGETSESGTLVLGIVFLSGLYVNLAYEQLGALARRFLPGSNADDSSE